MGTLDAAQKGIKKINLNNQRNQEAFRIKEKILINLSIEELKRLAYLLRLRDLEYKTEYDENLRARKIKIKLSKFDYVEKIAKLPYANLVLGLKSLKKSNLADEMEGDMSFVEEKYKQQIKNVSDGEAESEKTNDPILTSIIETITKDIISINPESWNKERSIK